MVCDCPLFSSVAKFEDGMGWPAFYDELPQARIKQREDASLDHPRIEVICSRCNSHLGYLFQDGPASKNGKRYSVNSSSLKFYHRQFL